MMNIEGHHRLIMCTKFHRSTSNTNGEAANLVIFGSKRPNLQNFKGLPFGNYDRYPKSGESVFDKWFQDYVGGISGL